MPIGVYERTPEIRKSLSEAGKLSAIKRDFKNNPEIRKRISDSIKKFYKGKPRWNTGKKPSIEARLKSSMSHRRRTIEGKNKFWKGGISKENARFRTSVEYKLWRDSVYNRDDYTCQVCRKRGVVLNAHHIKKFCDYPELRLEIDNGISLCESCHNESKGREVWYEKQLVNLQLLDWCLDELLMETAL